MLSSQCYSKIQISLYISRAVIAYSTRQSSNITWLLVWYCWFVSSDISLFDM